MKHIARIYTDFPTKFGIPRQSGLDGGLSAKIVFEPEYRRDEAIRGIEGFSYLWLIWEFSRTAEDGWHPTVRPPKLGGNTRLGVFATRSPFRPNPIGLSSVKLERVEFGTPQGAVLYVSGADIVNATPIYDIKPYLPYTDSHPDAATGFVPEPTLLEVNFPPELLARVAPDKRDALIKILAQNPRPSYQEDSERIYGFGFAGMEIKFTTVGNTINVCEVVNTAD